AAFGEIVASPRWRRLAAAGARHQRPLWASTRPKDPRYGATHYVDGLVAPETVCTLPPDTWAAYRERGDPELRVELRQAAAEATLAAVEEAGIDLEEIAEGLESEGVQLFAASHDAAVTTVAAAAERRGLRGGPSRGAPWPG